MRVDNTMAYFDYMSTKPKANRVYLAVTNNLQLYIIKRVGAGSWDAFNIDVISSEEHIHSNKKDIFSILGKAVEIDYVCEFDTDDKVSYRKAVMEFMLKGTIGLNIYDVTVEKKIEPQNKRGFAVYKEDGTPWTKEEYNNVLIVSDVTYHEDITHFNPHIKYIFDDGTDEEFMRNWTYQNIDDCTIIEYKDFIK